MQLARMRVTVRLMMIGVAVASVCSAVFRLHPSLESLVAGVSSLSFIADFRGYATSLLRTQFFR
jgi:hypothetical protein